MSRNIGIVVFAAAQWALASWFGEPALAQRQLYTPRSEMSWEGLMNPHLWDYQLLVADARAKGQSRSAKERRTAETLLKRAQELEPRRTEALAALGDLYLKWGQWKKAVEVFQKLKRFYREKMPRSVLFFTAVARSRSGDYHRAGSLFRSLVRQSDPPLLKAKLWNNAAQAAMAAGRLTRALAWFDLAVGASRGYRPALYGKAVALLRDGQIEAAAERLHGMARLEPELKTLYVRKYFFMPPADRMFHVAAMLEVKGCFTQASVVWKRYFGGLPQSPWKEAVQRFRARVKKMVTARPSARWCEKHADAVKEAVEKEATGGQKDRTPSGKGGSG